MAATIESWSATSIMPVDESEQELEAVYTPGTRLVMMYVTI